MQPALDCTPRQPHQLTDLFVGEILDISQHDDLALVFWELLEGLPDDVLGLGSVDGCVWRGSIAGDLALGSIIVIGTVALEGLVAV